MPFFTILIFFLQFSLGFLLTRYIDTEKRLNRVEYFFAIVILGPTTSCFLLLLMLLILGSWDVAIIFLWALLTGTFLISINKIPLSKWRYFNFQYISYSFLTSLSFWVMLVLFLVYSGILFGGFLLNEDGYPSVISLGWADTSYHLSMIGKLREADPFILEQPIASGKSLTYPFMINLLTALYQRIGFPLFSAWHISNAIYGISFFFIIYQLGKRFLNNSVLVSIFVAIVLFGGGIGFLLYFSDLTTALSNGGFDLFKSTIFNPPHEYTHLQFRDAGRDPSEYGLFHNIYWIVPAISFLSHQRSFLPGIALATLLFIGLTAYRGNKNIWRWTIVWGMIPLFHTHSFISASIILACWTFFDFKNYRSWVIGGIIGLLMAIPQILYLMPPDFSDEFSFLQPWLGWMMCTHHTSWYKCDTGIGGIDTNIFWFWTKNFGIVFWGWAAAILIYCLYKRNIITKDLGQFSIILIPSIFLFVIPNLFLLQPWEFDNNKVLYYWWILASISTILVIKSFFNNHRMSIIVFALLVICSTLSGMIDTLSRIANTRTNHYGYYDTNDVKLAEWINQNTLPNSRFLTGDFVDQYVPMLTGRSIYLGYPGWLWTQGKAKLSNQRKNNAYNYLKTGNANTMCEERIKYVVWDRRLLTTYPDANKDNILSSANIVYSENGNEVFEIKCN